jgi:serine-type D-Ala-D-Ala carboxypeptidase (penicillin-binding protein 5/6)
VLADIAGRHEGVYAIIIDMKYWFSYTVSVICAGILFALLYWVFLPANQKSLNLASPLPEFLTLYKNKQVTLLDLWTPVVETFANQSDHPQIEAKAVLMYDLKKDAAIYEKNAHMRVPMASLTKIMTAIITLEDKDMPEMYTVNGADLVGEDSMGLEAGEVLPKEELLYGLMLNSGNDAAEVLAHNYPAGRQEFLQAMQDKAQALGLKDTLFSNPSGLQGDGEQYTTAYDLLVITKYALETFPLFRTIVSTYQHDVPGTRTHKAYTLYNETNLLTTYPGVKGVKTGYTPEAGMCLVTYYENDNTQLVGILLNSPNRRGEMKQLLDFSLHSLGQTPPLPS